MKKLFIASIALSLLLLQSAGIAAPKRFGQLLCESSSKFQCYKVKRGDSWKKLFPNEDTRDMMKRLNRINMRLRVGWIIAIPPNPEKLTHFDVAPFDLKIDGSGYRTVIIDLSQLAWGAYDEDGNLLHWGPASGGKGWCKDVDKPCRTHTGNYTIYRKQGYDCTSSKFPLPYGGAAMPYCMHYYRAFALHGSFEVPGYNASHGCVRMFITDARWLNHQFANYDTKVIVKPY